MDSLLLYLLKVSIGLILFYLTFLSFFSRDTFYLRNRIFLIGMLLLSPVIPLLKVFNISNGNSTFKITNIIDGIAFSGTTIGASVSEKISSFDINNLLIWVYFSITGFFLLRILISILRTFVIIRSGTVIDTGFPKIVLSESDHPPFSFFPYVVIPVKTYESGDYSEIERHEIAHITQGHTFDLLLTEIFISLLWFNPVVWLIRRSVRLNHEYLADSFSIKATDSIKEYQYKLLNIPKGLMNVPLAHNFTSLIKNRIIMINKRPTRNYAALKSIIILPVTAILFLMFSFKPGSDKVLPGSQVPLFSKASELQILKFLAMNTGYPQEAKNSSDTGQVFVVVKMNRGGIVKECKAFTGKSDINVPFLPGIVIVGYKPSVGQGTVNSAKSAGDEHQALKNESLRMAKRLSEIKIPEWEQNDMEFAIEYKFILK